MRRAISAATLVVAASFGFILLLGVGASADIVKSRTPYTPGKLTVNPATPAPVPGLAQAAVGGAEPRQASGPAVPTSPAPATTQQAEPVASPAPAPDPSVAPTPVDPGPSVKSIPSQPVPEHVVTRAPPAASRLARSRLIASNEAKPFQQTVQTVKHDLSQIGAFLGEVASACKVGVGTGSGGPVLVFAVLGMAAALIRRRAFRARPATDEDVAELLYAGDVIKPG